MQSEPVLSSLKLLWLFDSREDLQHSYVSRDKTAIFRSGGSNRIHLSGGHPKAIKIYARETIDEALYRF